jgi:hypothetical protein
VAAQDEGQLPFERLPLRELKDWLEDWMDLPSVSVIGGTGGGVSAPASIEPIEHEFFGGYQVPRWRGWKAADKAFTIGSIECVRFSVWEDFTVSGAKIMETVGINAADAFDLGIYNAAGTSKLASSGVLTAPTGGAGTPINFPFTANQSLAKNTQYILALLQTAGGGSANSYTAVDTSASTLNRWLGNTIGTATTFVVTTAGGYTVLPADLTAAGTYNGSQQAGPFATLTRV